MPAPEIELDGVISTRTPHAGSDLVCKRQHGFLLFQPALPMRGVTPPVLQGRLHVRISTRTPHAGSDGRKG